ncbi:unnamed protein product [Danaus chrysippus]|uniref:(African queen) hypothetical protein n=1 Tax=Danaus chrysippus TaxID=151541 RepID=A0A8J2RDI9_9NEOP|nr:unnamed protein product [Danaus chrysippus]
MIYAWSHRPYYMNNGSDNASMPYVNGNYDVLYEFIHSQNQWVQYGDRVWVNHIDYVTQCTSFSYSDIEITDCEQKNAFICEIDPKISIDPLSWRGDALVVSFVCVLGAALLLVALALVAWYYKSKHRHVQRLERRNSIRQSLHSVRSIGSINGGFPDTTYRRKMVQMSTRSTDTLTKGSDYKKMLASTTSMESMEKSQFNSSLEDTQSFDIYEAHNPNNIIQLKHSTFNRKPASPEYSVPQNRPYNLAYKNEGYKENSASLAPSMNTVATEELPIIHHPGGITSHDDDTLSPTSPSQYFNSDTLPLTGDNSDDPIFMKRELEKEGKIYGPYGARDHGGQPKLSFLMELRSKLPEQPQAIPATTFGHRRDEPQYYDDRLPSPQPPGYQTDYPTNYDYETSYPESYQASATSSPDLHPSDLYTRSRSEALLETNFDFEDSQNSQLSEANRAHSQPLETAM